MIHKRNMTKDSIEQNHNIINLQSICLVCNCGFNKIRYNSIHANLPDKVWIFLDLKQRSQFFNQSLKIVQKLRFSNYIVLRIMTRTPDFQLNFIFCTVFLWPTNQKSGLRVAITVYLCYMCESARLPVLGVN